MKTRTGFVSNSSSTSFVVVGWAMSNPTKKQRKILDAISESDEEFIDGNYPYCGDIYGYGFMIDNGEEWTFEQWCKLYTTRKERLKLGIELFGDPKIYNLNCEL